MQQENSKSEEERARELFLYKKKCAKIKKKIPRVIHWSPKNGEMKKKVMQLVSLSLSQNKANQAQQPIKFNSIDKNLIISIIHGMKKKRR